MAAENIGAAAGHAHVAERELERAVGAGVIVTDGVLGSAHTPDESAGTVIGHRLGGGENLLLGDAGNVLDFLRIPLLDLGHDFVHAVDTLTDEFLVLPAVFEDVPHHAPDDADVGSRADTQEMIGVRRGTGIARIDNDDRRVILFFRLEDVLQRDRVRLGRVGTDQQDRFRVMDVVIRVCHRPVTPGIGYPGYRGRVTDARLVIDIVGAPHRGEFAKQVGLFVVVLGGTQPEHRVGTRLFAYLEHLVADFVDRLVPGNLLPLAVDQLGGILQAAFAVPVFANRGTLGAMRAFVERMIESRLLPCPDAVLNFRDDAATDRTVGADRLDFLDLTARRRRNGRIGFFHHDR